MLYTDYGEELGEVQSYLVKSVVLFGCGYVLSRWLYSYMGNIFQAQIYYVEFEGRHEILYRSTGELGASKTSGPYGWSLK